MNFSVHDIFSKTANINLILFKLVRKAGPKLPYL